MASKKAPETVIKDPEEEKYVNFDFTQDLLTSETLSGTPIFSTTPDDEILVIDQVSVSGKEAQALYKSGTINTKYEIKCVVSASNNQKYIGRGDLLVT